MLFKQLFEPVSSTYTYLIGCGETGQALLIDPVLPTWERDLAEAARLRLKLVFTLVPIHTPGHTDNHFAYFQAGRLYTGDALLIEGCGRTDFQSGDPAALYHSVRGKLLSYDDDTLVYPAHDYEQRRVSSIGQEKARNPRLGGARTLEEFVELMNGLNLAYPRFIDYAVPGNRACGACPPGVPEHLQQYCVQIGESRQG